MLRVREGVSAVDARGDPGDEQGDEEEKCNASVKESLNIFLAQSDGTGGGGDTKHCGSRGFTLSDLDIHGVSVVAIVDVTAGDFAHLEIWEGWFARGGCDGHFGCCQNTCERVFVEGVQKAREVFQGISFFPYVMARHDVDDDGGENGDPSFINCIE